MSRDIIIVPTYDRPEYLAVCLERLAAARGAQGKELWVCQDRHTNDGILDMAASNITASVYPRFKDVDFASQIPHSYYGNSYNILTTLKHAYECGADRVYLVEDDVMVMEDFFLWHEAMQQQEPDAFVTIASPIRDSLEFAINGPEVMETSPWADPFAYYVSKTAYSSIGVCINRDALHFIVPDFCNERTYSKLGPGIEQDILIKKQMQSVKCTSVWPYLPRAYHTGWYGYHRNTGLKFNGTLQEKIDALRRALYDQTKIDSMALAQNIHALPVAQPDKWWWEGTGVSRKPFYQLRKFR